jgi:hypothetical protein
MMTTQERLQNYQAQYDQSKARTRQLTIQIEEDSEALNAENKRLAMLQGAIMALQEEMKAAQQPTQ